jgi:hypothetical protein
MCLYQKRQSLSEKKETENQAQSQSLIGSTLKPRLGMTG